MSLTGMWTHGNSVAIEEDGSGVSFVKRGFGTDLLLRPNQACWTHAAIRSPTVLHAQRATLLRVFVIFKTHVSISIEALFTDIHVFDGIDNLMRKSAGNIRGEDLKVDGSTTFHLDAPRQIFTGVGVSMHWFNKFIQSGEPSGG